MGRSHVPFIVARIKAQSMDQNPPITITNGNYFRGLQMVMREEPLGVSKRHGGPTFRQSGG
ncbi:hypothetical protein GCM10009824_15050 [Kocuria atrinae]|uniref:Uncharacterized protein n=1 Tax=Kocuria atrinae TaxID=592377 RepID=A0ABN2XQX4_9MICC